jgi:hypothetical protein
MHGGILPEGSTGELWPDTVTECMLYVRMIKTQNSTYDNENTVHEV